MHFYCETQATLRAVSRSPPPAASGGRVASKTGQISRRKNEDSQCVLLTCWVIGGAGHSFGLSLAHTLTHWVSHTHWHVSVSVRECDRVLEGVWGWQQVLISHLLFPLLLCVFSLRAVCARVGVCAHVCVCVCVCEQTTSVSSILRLNGHIFVYFYASEV